WAVAQAGAVLLPFAFGLYFAAEHRFGEHLWPLGLLMLLLVVAACWIARERTNAMLLPLGVAGGVLAVIATWLLSHDLTAPLVSETTVVCLALAGAFHLFLETGGEEQRAQVRPAAGIVALGLLG